MSNESFSMAGWDGAYDHEINYWPAPKNKEYTFILFNFICFINLFQNSF